MSSSPQKPTPSLVLWELLVTGEEPAMSKTKPNLEAADRKRLAEAGLIELETRGRATHILTTDKAWDRALDDLIVEGSRSPYASTVLQHILTKTKQFLSKNDISLAEFLRSEDSVAASSDTEETSDNESGSEAEASSTELAEKIKVAYTKVSEGRYNVRVRLAALRKHLESFSKKDIDRVLGEMELSESLVLMSLNDPQDIQDKDEAAAVDVGGQKRHIVYMKE
ncbi:MAG: hypothetical protein AAF171_07510 [Cyanobacteria bacterium P01_A01_bin.116]